MLGPTRLKAAAEAWEKQRAKARAAAADDPEQHVAALPKDVEEMHLARRELTRLKSFRVWRGHYVAK